MCIRDSIYVEVGSNVQKGSMLVRMDQTQLNNTKLTYANLAVELQRMEALKESGAISKQVYDKTKLGYDQTEESLAFLEKNTFVRAPFSGVISARNYEAGELYSGMPILVLTQINTLKALINIPESYFPLVKKGMRIDIKSDIYPGESFSGTIEIVYPTIDAATHTFPVSYTHLDVYKRQTWCCLRGLPGLPTSWSSLLMRFPGIPTSTSWTDTGLNIVPENTLL